MSLIERPLVRRVLTSSVVDALTTPHGIDRYLELVDPGWSIAEVRGRVDQIRRQTPTSVTLTLSLNGAWRGHEAGQFVRVGAPVDGAIVTRCYTIETPSSWPGATTIELTVGADPRGALSPHLVHGVRLGDLLRLSQAEGSFTLPDPLPERIVLVAAGTGITPFIGMIRQLCASGAIDDVAVTLIAYAATPVDQLHVAELSRMAATHPTLAVVRGCTERPGAAALDGLFVADHLDRAEPAWRDAEVFACGSNPFMTSVQQALLHADRAAHFHTEAFAPAFVPSPEDETSTGSVVFDTSGTRADDVATTILEAAELVGLEPTFGCRMGICHTCTRTKHAGCVRDLRTGTVSGPEPADIQICTSVPVGDVVVDL